jgi:hypothetical protein
MQKGNANIDLFITPANLFLPTKYKILKDSFSCFGIFFSRCSSVVIVQAIINGFIFTVREN